MFGESWGEVLQWERWDPRTGGAWRAGPGLRHQGCRTPSPTRLQQPQHLLDITGFWFLEASLHGNETSICLGPSLSH